MRNEHTIHLDLTPEDFEAAIQRGRKLRSIAYRDTVIDAGRALGRLIGALRLPLGGRASAAH